MAIDSYDGDNREAWNKRTEVHIKSRFYAVDRFLRGESSLRPPELALLPDVGGLRLLHLQCHFGLDSLSWARRGAIVTGVDFSDVAIQEARKLSARTGLAAEFVCADVQTLGRRFSDSFDIVFTSYGVLCWLEDLRSWANAIACSLVPSGRFVLVEFHPALDLVFNGKISGTPGYFSRGPVRASSHGTYADPTAAITYSETRWQHSIGDVIGALLAAGLSLVDFREFPHSSYKLFDHLNIEQGGVWHASGPEAQVPHMFSVVAESK